MTDKKQKIQIEGHKLMYHVDEVSRWLKGDVVAPIYVEIGLINSCNHNCVFCIGLPEKQGLCNKQGCSNQQPERYGGIRS